MKPYFKAVREPTFRAEREKFVRAVADVPDPNGKRTAMGSSLALPVGSDRRVGR